MEKSKIQNWDIEVETLEKYLFGVFPDIMLPSLNKFIEVKVQNQDKVRGITTFMEPNHEVSPQIRTTLQSQAVLYLHSGVVELHRKAGRHWQREIEYKEGFFSLINFRNMESIQPQWLRLVVKTKCSLSIFPIKSSFGYLWLRQNWYKNQILAKIFYFNDTGIQIERKKERFKEFIKSFKYEVLRRDTRFITEGKKNQQIYVIGEGEARVYKQMRVKHSKGQVHKDVEMFYIREGSVMGMELFLMSSKPIHTIINHHTIKNHSIEEEANEESEEQEEVNEVSKKKKKKKFGIGKISVDSGGYELYAPHQNISNYSVVVQSANLQVYTIPIDRLVSTIFERQKSNFLNFLQQTYITFLRRTHQKMAQMFKKQQQKAANNTQNVNIIASTLFASNLGHTDKQSHESEGIMVRKSEVGVSTDKINVLRREGVKQQQKRSLDKRTQLITYQNKPKTDFKNKIEHLLEEKLRHGSENKKNENQLRITQDLAQIFRKNNDGRTEEAIMQRQVLDRKTGLLAKRGGWQPGWDMLRKQGVQVTDRPSPTPLNYLSHTNREELAFKAKQKCVSKIHNANKIKQQFMKIKSQCVKCTCYDNFQNFTSIKRSMTSFSRTAYKTTEGWGRASSRTSQPNDDEPLEAVYNKIKFLSQKAKQKYNHNLHLLKCRRNKDKLQRRKSAPVL